MMDQDKAAEYQQVAALVCMDLDILAEVAQQPGMTAEELVAQILYTKEKKDELIADPAVRSMRFTATSLLWNTISSGEVVKTFAS